MIRLRICLICLAWYKPDAHAEHCPNCGAMPVKFPDGKHTHVRYSESLNKLIEVVRPADYIPLALRAARIR